uniref:Uncharacterized protein n=1 Tax=Micrurus paraensis TaxID=1970185 RepID=A0A2D4L7H9_9SAUR
MAGEFPWRGVHILCKGNQSLSQTPFCLQTDSRLTQLSQSVKPHIRMGNMGSGSSKVLNGSPLGELLEVWDEWQRPVLSGREKKRKKKSKRICKKWALLRDDTGRPI